VLEVGQLRRVGGGASRCRLFQISPMGC
jgi:hypothetical protein